MDGTVQEQDGRYVVRFERHLRHPIEKVWEAITEPDRLGDWLAAGTIELRPGGSADLTFANAPTPDRGTVLTGTVREVDPPRLLEYSWRTPDGEEEPVRWELSPEDGGTRLVLTHTVQRPAEVRASLSAGLTPVDSRVVGCLAGWHDHLDSLALVLAGQPGSFSIAGWADWYVRYVSVHRPRVEVAA